jgi:2'-5' RNA ligase
MNESALFVVVPEAEPLVGTLRAQFDPAALVGIPAHITVLFPFMPREHLTSAVLGKLRAVLSSLPSFEFALERVAKFPRSTYLAPEPAEPFAAMTAALVREFPDYPPYEGRFSRVIPHLTVADQDEAFALIAERELVARVKVHGAVRATCMAVDLFENSDKGYWRRYDSFALSGGV